MCDSKPQFKKQPKGFATKAIHVGQDPEQWNSNSVVPPISLSTTFKQEALGQHKGFEYSRSGNPTRNVLEECLASLDNGKYALTFSSGMGAITTICALLSQGDHIITCDDAYGGTKDLLRKVTVRQGIEIDFVDLATNIGILKTIIKKNTKLVLTETPTNPMIKIIDIEKLSKICHDISKDIIVAIDNTFLTPYLQRPLDLGADLVFYSLTKYFNGHGDVVMGSVVVNDDDLHKRLRFLQNAMGAVPSPFDCFLVNRGLKTLQLRMEKHAENGLAVARFLENHSSVEKVIHPGLKSHPQHELALTQMYGHSSIFSFYLKGGFTESKKFFKSLKYFKLAGSLGAHGSLTELPILTSHVTVPEDERIQLGITDNLIRLSVGLEDIEDLIEDLDQALKSTLNLNNKPIAA